MIILSEKKAGNLFNIFLLIVFFTMPIAICAASPKSGTAAPTRKVQIVGYIKGMDRGAEKDCDSPRSIYVDREKQILYVIATPSGPIYKFDLQNDYKFIEAIGKDAGFSNELMDIKVNPNGELYVVDAKKNTLFLFDAQGSLKQVIKAKDNRKNKDQELGVIFIDLNRRGDIFLSDKGGQGIQVLDAEGNYLYEIVKARAGNEEFGFPSISQLKINSNEEVFVLDNLMLRVVKFNAKGKTLAVFGGRGDIAGKFVDARGIAIDQKDRVYVVEQLTGTIQVFDKDGNFLYVLVNENGERLIMQSPSRIDVDMSGRVFVLERRNDRVTILKFVD